MRALVIATLGALALAPGCQRAPSGPEGGIQNDLEEPVGQGRTWVYRSTGIYPGLEKYPDTLVGFSRYNCVGDTLIDGRSFWVVDEIYLSREGFKVDTAHSRGYIHLGEDSVVVYHWKHSSWRSTGGVFKRSAEQRAKVRPVPAVATTAARWSDARYDTSHFGDMVIPIVYPLVEGSRWDYRAEDDPSGGLPVQREYVGEDTIAVPAGRFRAQVMEWDWDSSALPGVVERRRTDWLAGFGLVKWEAFFRDTSYGSAGSDPVINGFQLTIEYYSSAASAIPMLVPLLPQPAIDSALGVVLEQWDWDRYREWLNAVSFYCDTAFCSGSEVGVIELTALDIIAATWGAGDPSWTLRQGIEYLESVVPPTSGEDLHDPSWFTDIAVTYYASAQGWADCDLDWQASGRPLLDSGEFQYGRSASREELAEALFARFDQRRP